MYQGIVSVKKLVLHTNFSKKLVFIFLAMLQFVAPLVHAHAGESSEILVSDGLARLHIPGLESYSNDHDASLFEAVGTHFNAEGIIIGVDAGIKQNHAELIIDSGDNYFIPQQSIIIEYLISPFDINFSPPVLAYLCQYLVTSHTPRAPPAQ